MFIETNMLYYRAMRHARLLLPGAAALFFIASTMPSSALAGLNPDSRVQMGLDAREDVQETANDADDDDREWRRSRSLGGEAEDDLTIPILIGVEVNDLVDTWGDARSNGRTHEGIDIMAPRGSLIVSPTNAVVAKIGTYGLGGKYVYTNNPGGERFYFAHLDGYADGLREGQRLNRGDLIGYVGNTGNAAGGPTHLHFTIYKRGAHNPYPRLTRTFNTRDRVEALSSQLTMVENAPDRLALAQTYVSRYGNVFREAQADRVRLPALVTLLMDSSTVRVATGRTSGTVSPHFTRDLELGDTGSDVTVLQEFLITTATGDAALSLQRTGATGYFGPLTERALAEYQHAADISPAIGYLGPLTRAHIQTG